MKTLNVMGQHILKILHLFFCVMWVGGVMALVCVQLGAVPTTREMMLMATKCHLVIDEFFLIPGGVGILLTAIAYGSFTKWGFFKRRWITVKWIVTFILVAIGAGYMGIIIKENMVYSLQLLHKGVSSDFYWNNVYHVAIAGIVQLVLFVSVIVISVIKPWKGR